MAASYHQLLDAVIQHLEDRKRDGVRFISVKPETLASLRSPAGFGGSAPRGKSAVKGISRSAAAGSFGSAVARAGGHGAGASAVSTAPAPAVGSAAAARPADSAAAVDPAGKRGAMEELKARALACVKCVHLANSRRNVVFGVGDINARLMFVGEAPGADEDVQGEPFVGTAGQLLTRIIQTMGLSRETVYIANILKCRPDTPEKRTGNRKPTPEEMRTCIPFLEAQIDLVRPQVLVALGATAVEGLLGKAVGITRLRGQWQSYREIPFMPTFHPSYLLHNQALGEKRKVWEDMLQVLEKLSLPISEKQRGYFLRA